MLKRLLLKLLGKELEQLKTDQYTSGYRAGEAEAKDTIKKKRTADSLSHMQFYIGKKMIYCSNEEADPVFAIAQSIDTYWSNSQPMYKAKNVLTDEIVYLPYGSVWLADENIVDALLKLTPLERWNLKVTDEVACGYVWKKAYPPRIPLTPPDVLKQKLQAINFI